MKNNFLSRKTYQMKNTEKNRSQMKITMLYRCTQVSFHNNIPISSKYILTKYGQKPTQSHVLHSILSLLHGRNKSHIIFAYLDNACYILQRKKCTGKSIKIAIRLHHIELCIYVTKQCASYIND